MGKGHRPKSRSQRRYHKRTVRAQRKLSSMPPASDVEVRDADGNLIRVERTKKPLT